MIGCALLMEEKLPNHVTTRCVVTGPADDIVRFREQCIRDIDGEQCLDFNTIIPMPAVMRDTVSGSDASLGIEALTGQPKPEPFFGGRSHLDYPWIKELGIETTAQLRAWAEKERPKAIAEGQKALAAWRETGFYDWYDWSVERWGTKWNSYSFGIDDKDPPDAGELRFHFDTAWSFPEPIFERLAEMFQTLCFECVCYDEGGGFAGEGCFNGDPGFEIVEATDELYERVYGHPPERDEDEIEETA